MVTENQIYYHMNSLIPASVQGQVEEAREELAKDRSGLSRKREDEGYQETVEKDDNSVNSVLHVLSQCGTLQLVYFSPFQ